MSLISFDNYTRLAGDVEASHTEVAGRYTFQAAAERRIIADVVAKLALDTTDRLLEVGCGPGNLLLPLSHQVAATVGIDNAVALERLRARGGDAMAIKTLAGNFLDIELGDLRFNKVLVYSVIQYLDSPDAARQFLLRGLKLLVPGGKLMLGDLPNIDTKARFAASARGREVAREWQALTANAASHRLLDLPIDSRLLRVDDALVMSLLATGREAGCESYLLPQPDNLPFGHTREDLLFMAHG